MEKTIKIGSDFNGVGAFHFAMERIAKQKGFKVKNSFACDVDKHARKSFLISHGTKSDLEILQTKECKKIDDIYYRGLVKMTDKNVIPPTEDDWKYVKDNEEIVARSFSFYYPWNVYSRQISEESDDIYISSFPCQSFSIAGKRQGKDDDKGRGILFLNSLEFIRQNKPRFFIFENVKGLLSDDGGKTFNQIINLSGGKSINGTSVFISDPDSVPYHVYHKVMNAKNHGIPQNRERIFIIGIRDDEDNNFVFPKEEHLELRLKHILEPVVDEKYFLSEKMVQGLFLTSSGKDKSFPKAEIKDINQHSACQTSRMAKMGRADNYIGVDKMGFINQDTQTSSVYPTEGISPTLSAGTHGYAQGYIQEIIQLNNPTHSNDRVYDEKGIAPTHSVESGGNRQAFVQVKSATSKGFEEATIEDSINFSNPQSETRRGRVGKGVAQTLDTSCNQGVIQMNNSKESGGKQPYQQNRIYDTEGLSPALCKDKSDLCIPVLTPDRIEKRQNGRRFKEDGDPMFTLTAQDKHGISDGFRIRKLTPLECGRLMNFPDSHTENCRKAGVSDSQLYKQAGNSIVVRCLELIISNFNL